MDPLDADPDPPCRPHNTKEIKTFFLWKWICSKKWFYYGLYELIFMCVKQKCNFYFQKYDIMVIFIDFCVIFPLFWMIYFATRIRIRIIDTNPDPGGQNDANPTGSGSTSLSLTSQHYQLSINSLHFHFPPFFIFFIHFKFVFSHCGFWQKKILHNFWAKRAIFLANISRNL